MLEGDDRTVGVREGGLEMGEDLGRGLVLRRDDWGGHLVTGLRHS